MTTRTDFGPLSTTTSGPSETLPVLDQRPADRLLATPVPLPYTAAQEGRIMGDESEPVTAVAKAVEETAKTGRALVEAGSDLARFVGKALGTAPEDTIGLLGADYLRHLRIRNLDNISRKTEEILQDRGIDEPKVIGPKALLPALEAASEESDETLQNMWAELLANSMDPNKDTSLQRVFTETLKQFELIDVLFFQRLGKIHPNKRSAKDFAADLKTRISLVKVSADRLAKIGVVEEAAVGSVYYLTALGIELSHVCNPDAAD